jgi:hypothetical protein
MIVHTTPLFLCIILWYINFPLQSIHAALGIAQARAEIIKTTNFITTKIFAKIAKTRQFNYLNMKYQNTHSQKVFFDRKEGNNREVVRGVVGRTHICHSYQLWLEARRHSRLFSLSSYFSFSSL